MPNNQRIVSMYCICLYPVRLMRQLYTLDVRNEFLITNEPKSAVFVKASFNAERTRIKTKRAG